MPFREGSVNIASKGEILIPVITGVSQTESQGIITPTLVVEDKVPFKIEYLVNDLNVTPDSLVLFVVVDDSMSRNINKGDWVLVDVAEKDITKNGTFLFSSGNDLFIREAEFQFGDILLKAVNTNFRDFIFDGTKFSIIGKITWRSGKY